MKEAESRLREIALAYPETYEEFPWGERVIKVNKKVFVFLYATEERLHMTTKLPFSATVALMQPWAQPAGYGLGRAGWVTAMFEKQEPPFEMLAEWIDESYRAVAPKALVAQLGGRR